MSTAGSVTHWIGQLKAGDPAAAQKLWERYFQQLVDLARKKLRSAPRRSADEHDVVQVAFESFFQGAAENRFPQLNDRDDLWQILFMLVERKAIDQVSRERRQKRGGGAVKDEAALDDAQASTVVGLDRFIGRDPTPESAAQVAEEFEQLMVRLQDESLQKVAQLKMEGYSNDELGTRLGCSGRTIQRKLSAIRRIWK
jgi:RNA polymerase sigma factor (sigma-70 family)